MRKIPLRKCVVTQEKLPKNELLRIVKTPDDQVKVDVSGKLNGRGAYLKKDPLVLEKAKKKGVLERSLEIKIEPEVYDSILKVINE
ncbi:MAG: RNase P modulator RnpM [Anaerorhabdus sp.]